MGNFFGNCNFTPLDLQFHFTAQNINTLIRCNPLGRI